MSKTNGVRIFPGRATKQLTHDGKPADSASWYWEPADYDGDVLWDRAYVDIDAARAAAQAHLDVVCGLAS